MIEGYGTIVVGWDEGEESGRGLDRAATLARASGARLTVVHVVPGPYVPATVGPIDPVLVPPPELGAVDSEGEAERREALRTVLERLEIAADVVTREGDVGDAVLSVAEERHADLVVVGAHEPGFTDRLLGLDVGGAVQRRAHCDVLVVR